MKLLKVIWILFSAWLVWTVSKECIGEAIVAGIFCVVFYIWFTDIPNETNHQNSKNSSREQNDLINK